jgi:hypothetical protein
VLFSTADDVHEILGRLIQELAVDPELGPRLSALDTVVELNCRHPDAKLTLVAKATEAPSVNLGDAAEGQPAAELVLTMDADVAHALWLGRQNVAIGIARGAIQAKGDSRKIIDLLGMSDQIAPRYTSLLRAVGREDLTTVEPVGEAAPEAAGDATTPDAASEPADEATTEAGRETTADETASDAGGEATSETASA